MSRRNYLKYKEAARAFVKSRIAHYNQAYQVPIKRIAIKNSRSRWGSCSRKGNLNFNYRIVLLPLPMADYVIVHEMCHLKEFNHSPKFWNLVAQTVPNWKTIRKQFKNVSLRR